MKNLLAASVLIVILSVGNIPISAQDDLTIVTPTSEAAEGLD